MSTNMASAGTSRSSPRASSAITTLSSHSSPRASVTFERLPHLDARVLLNALDQVARHVLVERRSAAYDRHLPGLLGHVERRLPGRVGAADDDDVLSAVARRLPRRRAVMDARTDQPLDARRLEAAVVHAGCRDARSRVDHRPAGELDLQPAVRARPDADELRADEDLRPQPARLPENAARELGAADAVRKARVVLDPRARPGLPARRERLDDERAKTLRGGVERRGEAGRPGTDDQDVVGVVLRRGR